MLFLKLFQEHAQSAAFSNNGEIVIIGTTSGRWFVMDSETREMYSQHQDGNEPIQVFLICFIIENGKVVFLKIKKVLKKK